MFACMLQHERPYSPRLCVGSRTCFVSLKSLSRQQWDADWRLQYFSHPLLSVLVQLDEPRRQPSSDIMAWGCLFPMLGNRYQKWAPFVCKKTPLHFSLFVSVETAAIDIPHLKVSSTVRAGSFKSDKQCQGHWVVRAHRQCNVWRAWRVVYVLVVT